MRNVASLERSNIAPGNVRAPIREAAKQESDVSRRYRHQLRGIFRVADLPSALPHQPVDESYYGSRQAFVDSDFRNSCASIWLWHGQNYQAWLSIDRRRTAM